MASKPRLNIFVRALCRFCGKHLQAESARHPVVARIVCPTCNMPADVLAQGEVPLAGMTAGRPIYPIRPEKGA